LTSFGPDYEKRCHEQFERNAHALIAEFPAQNTPYDTLLNPAYSRGGAGEVRDLVLKIIRLLACAASEASTSLKKRNPQARGLCSYSSVLLCKTKKTKNAARLYFKFAAPFATE